ncbi:hypothetical protein BD289DRAFT_293665 [Coniella lustricola]|uniref:Uncharacterized protein n=1 Tax=Coniella lustricola TaxID=2025994 RepID=A0A2T3A520_9PEZI|nr:hypothetical protein BD289DRAFT_293665 [Coniella lustricola]
MQAAATQMWAPSHPPKYQKPEPKPASEPAQASESQQEPQPEPEPEPQPAQEPIWDLPLWLHVNPEWQNNLEAINRQHNVDIIQILQGMGSRVNLYYGYEGEEGEDEGVVRTHQMVFEYDPKVEEGSATEHRYFGGLITSASGTLDVLTLKPPRFLGELASMPARTLWATHKGNVDRLTLDHVLPFEAYSKLFREGFWNSKYAALGPLALRYPATLRPYTWDEHKFDWRHIAQVYGDVAVEWMMEAWFRLRLSNENPNLWRWLYFKMCASVQAESATMLLYHTRQNWKPADNFVWKSCKSFSNHFATLYTSMDAVVVFNDDIMRQFGIQTQPILAQQHEIQHEIADLDRKLQTNQEQQDRQRHRTHGQQEQLLALLQDRQIIVSQRAQLELQGRNLELQLVHMQRQLLTHLRKLPKAQLVELCSRIVELVDEFYGELSVTRSLLSKILNVTRGTVMGRTYAPQLRVRMSFYAILVCGNVLSGVRKILELASERLWRIYDPEADAILTLTLPDLETKVRTCQEDFCDLADLLRMDPNTHEALATKLFGTLPSGVRRTEELFYQDLALSELVRLAPDDPQRKVAEQWLRILDFSAELKNPPPGSGPANLNDQLAEINTAVAQVVQDEETVLAEQHPDQKESREVENPILVRDQPAPGESLSIQRCNPKSPQILRTTA